MRSKSLRRGRGGSQSRITEIGDESCRSSRMGGLGDSWDRVMLVNYWENFRRPAVGGCGGVRGGEKIAE